MSTVPVQAPVDEPALRALLKADGLYSSEELYAMTPLELVCRAGFKSNGHLIARGRAAGLTQEEIAKMPLGDIFEKIDSSERSPERVREHSEEKPEQKAVLDDVREGLSGLTDFNRQRFTEEGRECFDHYVGELAVAYVDLAFSRAISGIEGTVEAAQAAGDLTKFEPYCAAWSRISQTARAPGGDAPKRTLLQALMCEELGYQGGVQYAFRSAGEQAGGKPANLVGEEWLTQLANDASSSAIGELVIGVYQGIERDLFHGLLRRMEGLNQNTILAFATQFCKTWAGERNHGGIEAIKARYATVARWISADLAMQMAKLGTVDLVSHRRRREDLYAESVANCWVAVRLAHNDPANWKAIGGTWELGKQILNLEGQSITMQQLFRNLIVMGKTGSGKSTCIAQPITRELLRQGWGGIVFAVKGQERNIIERLAREEGRYNDLRIISQTPWEKWGNNILANSVRRFEQAGQFPNCEQPGGMCDKIMEFTGSGSASGDRGENQYFVNMSKALVRGTINLADLAGEELSHVVIGRVLEGRARGTIDPTWYASSIVPYLLEKARWRMKTVPYMDAREVRMQMAETQEYWLKTLPANENPSSQNSSSMLSCINEFTASASAMMDNSILKVLFAERTDYQMAEAFDGSIIVIDLPILDEVRGGDRIGRFAAGITTADWMNTIRSRPGPQHLPDTARPVVLLGEEMSDLMTTAHAEFLRISRDRRHMMFMVTQSLGQVAKSFSASNSSDQMTALMDTIATVITGQTSEPYTAKFMIEQAGKYVNISSSRGGKTSSGNGFLDSQTSEQVTDARAESGKEDVLDAIDLNTLNDCSMENPYAGSIVFTGRIFDQPPKYQNPGRIKTMSKQPNVGCRPVQFVNWPRPGNAIEAAEPSGEADMAGDAPAATRETEQPRRRTLTQAVDPAAGSQRYLHHHEIVARNEAAEAERVAALSLSGEDQEHPLIGHGRSFVKGAGKAFNALRTIKGLISEHLEE